MYLYNCVSSLSLARFVLAFCIKHHNPQCFVEEGISFHTLFSKNLLCMNYLLGKSPRSSKRYFKLIFPFLLSIRNRLKRIFVTDIFCFSISVFEKTLNHLTQNMLCTFFLFLLLFLLSWLSFVHQKPRQSHLIICDHLLPSFFVLAEIFCFFCNQLDIQYSSTLYSGTFH